MAIPENIHDVFIANPITTNASTDLMYFGQSPYGNGNDAAMTYVNFSAQFAKKDDNSNFSANNFLSGYTTTVTAAGITTLTVSSTEIQRFTGSTTQSARMPVTSTLVLGQSYVIINNSTGNVTPISSGGQTITVIPGGYQTTVTCVLTSGTTQTSWSASEITFAVFSPGAATLSAQGAGATATGNYSLSYGPTSSSLGVSAFSFGNAADANADYSFASGNAIVAGGQYSFAFGLNGNSSSGAIGDYSFAFGNNPFADGSYSFCFGLNSNALQAYSWASGNSATSTNTGSVVWNDSTGSGTGDLAANQFCLNFSGGYNLGQGSLNVTTAGTGLGLNSNSSNNGCIGLVTLSSGTVTFTNTLVTTDTIIFVTPQDIDTTGALQVVISGTSVTINSSNPIDSGVVAYLLIQKLG